MLTARRLQQLGFEIKNKQQHWWMVKDRFCLFPMNGSWAIGADWGELAVGPHGFIEIIETEDDLRKYLKERGPQGLIE
jgi:hypothetical protein